MTPTLLVNNVASGQVRGNQVHQVTPQVSPNVQQNLFAPPTQSNSFPPPPYFPLPFPPPPVPPSNVSIAPSAPASDLSAAISLMTNAVNQGNANTTITDASQRTTTQFADALQQTIQMGVNAQAEENKNTRLDKQFNKIKIFDGSNPAECHPWCKVLFTGFCRVWTFYQSPCCLHMFFLVFSFRGVRFCFGEYL